MDARMSEVLRGLIASAERRLAFIPSHLSIGKFTGLDPVRKRELRILIVKWQGQLHPDGEGTNADWT